MKSPLPKLTHMQWDLLSRGAGSCSSTAMAFSIAMNCKSSFTVTRYWSPACKRPTKLNVNSTLKDYATIRPDHPTGSADELVTLFLLSVPYRMPDGDILPNDDMAEVLAAEADPGAGGGGHTLAFVNVHVVLPPELRTRI